MYDFYADGKCITAESIWQARRIYSKTVGVAAVVVRYWDYEADGPVQ